MAIHFHRFIGLSIAAELSRGMPLPATGSDAAIEPDSSNRFYWQYQGKPVLLPGGSWRDNLFNHPTGLEHHIDLPVAAGGNYLRDTMSQRNAGNVFPYLKNSDSLFDLDAPNPQYWDRLKTFLQKTHERDIIVQLEVWDPWDYYANH